DPVLSPLLPLYPNPDGLLLFDLALDRYHLSLAERISLVYYHTGGPLITYLVEKGLEMRNIQVILAGISSGVSPDQIQKYLISVLEKA
ncbi:MAG: V-type ATPase subunit, partial [Methanobacteriota archaeon]